MMETGNARWVASSRPAVVLSANTLSLQQPWAVAFEPHASGLPLFSRVPEVARVRAKHH